MDGYEFYASARTRSPGQAKNAADPAPRSFLFLQGPISTFFDRLARALIARGHRVHRVNLHFGDRLFWRLPATHYRGRLEDWRDFVGAMLERHEVTDLVLHGDRRPYHIIAAEEARARGIAVIATDLGYVRPDWLTLEYDGMTTYSRFPRDPETIRMLAAKFPEPELGAWFHTPFWLIAALDIAYNLGLVFGRAGYPHYRYHSTVHPFGEYAGWLRSRPSKWLRSGAAAAVKTRLQAEPGSYFLVPLQLSTDFQIRAHSPFVDLRDAVRDIVASFAASTSRRKLVFVVHPLDNGLISWHRFVARLARQAGLAGQVFAIDGGTPAELLRNALGVVTINSTVGVTALTLGVPVKALGNAIFDVPGLTCQAPLEAFWHDQPRPDPGLMAAFLRALVGTTQVKGGYYEPTSQACATAGFVARLEQRPYPLPPLQAAEYAARAPRLPVRTVVVAGVSSGVGLALARAHAGPGMRLCLIGGSPATLDQAAADCRHRGALVETFCPPAGGIASIADFLAEFDRRSPVDALLVQLDASPERDEADGGPGMAAAMDVVAALAEPMRRRGCGHVMLLSNLAGRLAPAGLAGALAHRQALLAHGGALERRLWADGVAVTIVTPGRVAIRAASWLAAPEIATVGADRIGEAIAAGLHRHQPVVAVPGAAVAALRVLRLLSGRLRKIARNAAMPRVAAIAPAADRSPLAGKSASGD
jgi:capsular polysaccharide export protein